MHIFADDVRDEADFENQHERISGRITKKQNRIPGTGGEFSLRFREFFCQDLIEKESGSCPYLHGKRRGSRDKTITMGEGFFGGGGENDC